MKKLLQVFLLICLPLSVFAAGHNINGVADCVNVVGVANPAEVNGVAAAGGPVYDSVTAIEVRFNYHAGSAFVWIPSLNLSSYAGTAGSSTPYRIEIIDTSGYTMVGYLAEQGSGETLGGEFLSADEAACNNVNDFDAVATGWSANGTCNFASGQTGGYLMEWGPSNSYLYKYSLESVSCSGGNSPRPIASGVTLMDYYGLDSSGTYNFYVHNNGGRFGFYSTATNCNFSADNLSVKEVTGGPSTYSLKIVSTNGGSTYDWASKHASFSFTDVSAYPKHPQYKIKIYEN